MAKKSLRVLCVPGVGHKENDPGYQAPWKKAISEAVHTGDRGRNIEFRFVAYDKLFEQASLNPATVAEAFARLASSYVFHGFGDLFRRQRGLFDLPQRVRWTAGMVAQWAAGETLRKQTRERVRQSIDTFDPDVICAHSLGSLITYDLFALRPALAKSRWFVTLGSQIGHPAVRGTFGGRIVEIPVKCWFHLFNPEDDVFTAEIRLQANNFEQVRTHFDISGIADHDASEYLGHPDAASSVWRTIVTGGKLPASVATTTRAVVMLSGKPARRALLVGINDYPRESERLEGCVNDVYRMSEVLQELGFEPQDIRIVLNDRATASGITERLEWLLDGSRPEQTRVFFYSGHGAQIPSYGDSGEVDYLDECLVPVDFDWSPDRSLTDNEFHALYTQLPYQTNFVTILDCCHSGGMTRDAGLRVRGLSPPDDIRHRTMKWDPSKSMWVARDLKLGRQTLLERKADQDQFLGAAASTRRLGRAVPVWGPVKQFQAARAAYKHDGPYIPVLYQACQEDEYAYEYRHGVTSFGAFTYCLTTILRTDRSARKPVTYQQLLDKTADRLKTMNYAQTPILVGPSVKISQPIPFGMGAKPRKGKRS